MNREELIRVARGEAKADLAVKNCRLLNTLSGEIHPVDFAVAGGVVVGFGDYDAESVLDVGGRCVAPGLIEGHIHIESTMLAPHRFAEAVARRGTAAVVGDPHEIANVMGIEGVEYMIEATRDLPVAVFFTAPSCVPATHLETAGAVVTAADITGLFDRHPDRVLGLGEMMNFPGVLARDPEVMAKLEAAGRRPVDGHAPLLGGRDLAAYIAAGAGSDHESTSLAEAREKLRLGMHVMIREGTSEKNLDELIPLVIGPAAERLSLVSDDRHPADLMENGHLDHAVRRAIARGTDPVAAVRMASLNTARYFGLRGRGALAPGYRADFIVLDDLPTFAIWDVYLGGRPVGDLQFRHEGARPGNSMHVPPLDPAAFDVLPGAGRLRVMEIVPGQILTGASLVEPRVVSGKVVADPGRDIAKLAVVERHGGTGRIGIGFVKGLGLERGAIASTVAHDSHNLIVAGMDDGDMALAVRHLTDLGGGLAAVRDGRVTAAIALPIAGLMADASLGELAAAERALNAAAAGLGRSVAANPFMALSFLALPVIPHLKITDMGLVDVDAFAPVSLFEG